MKKIGPFEFPAPGDRIECAEWRPATFRRALASKVLVVGRTRVEGAWAAYIAAVPGANHDAEEAAAYNEGTKLAEEVARAVFPELADVPYAG